VELISQKRKKERKGGGRPNDKCEEKKGKKMRKERIRDGGMISCQISCSLWSYEPCVVPFLLQASWWCCYFKSLFIVESFDTKMF
jgi:hypothetical protein